MTRTVPAPVFETSGNVVQSALWNNGPKAMGDYYLSPPMFRGHQSAAQAVASNTYTAISLNVTDVDTDGGHSNVTNNSRYTCQVPGWYLVEGFAALQNTTAAQSILEVTMALNSTGGTPTSVYGLTTWVVKGANSFTAASGSGMLHMSAGDYLEIWCWQDSGTSINTWTSFVDLLCCMNVLWVHA